jgi:hypothetical protein
MAWADKSERRIVFETDLNRSKSVNEIKIYSNPVEGCWSDILPLFQSHLNSFPNSGCELRAEDVSDLSSSDDHLGARRPSQSYCTESH